MLKNILFSVPKFIPPFLALILVIWTLSWKGIALWRSAKNNQKYWFVTVFLLNTFGILEILYLSFFQKKI